jgi:hypothetical protein
MYMDGIPRVGMLAPQTQLGLQSSAERTRRQGFHMLACMRLIAPLAAPLIFIGYANGLPHHRPISTLIRLRSNPCGP